jgi:hypothetical protein
LFDGKDKPGAPYGIYVNKRGSRNEPRIDYFLSVRVTGVRTLKGNDINYIGDVDKEILKEKEMDNNCNNNIFESRKRK